MTSIAPTRSDEPHVPVMVNSVTACLNPRDGGIYLDGTLGAGGYSRALLDAADCRVIAIDRDAQAIDGAKRLEERFQGRLLLAHGRYSAMEQVARDMGFSTIDGITLDLGVSSMQIDQPMRGFSFMEDGPLDMRMGSQGFSAADAVNTLSQPRLTAIIRTLGEERRATAIAAAIVRQRSDKPIERTVELAELISDVLGPSARRYKRHPATRTFQGLRMYINQELQELASGLLAAERLLKAQGRLVVVAFHSLEDRVVKRFFQQRCQVPRRSSRHLPDAEAADWQPSFLDLARGGMKPAPQEVDRNPRARSARLRAGERTRHKPIDCAPGKLGVPGFLLEETAP